MSQSEQKWHIMFATLLLCSMRCCTEIYIDLLYFIWHNYTGWKIRYFCSCNWQLFIAIAFFGLCICARSDSETMHTHNCFMSLFQTICHNSKFLNDIFIRNLNDAFKLGTWPNLILDLIFVFYVFSLKTYIETKI